MMIDIDTDLNDRLAGLRHARGMLALHNKDLANINQQIADVEAQIAISQDRQHAEQTVQREQLSKQQEEEVARLREEVKTLTEASAKALNESRAGYHQGATSMKAHLEAEASLRSVVVALNRLTGERTTITNAMELQTKRALQIAAVGIKPITGHPSYFGGGLGKISYPNTLKEWKETT
jgi:hypothetical protein